MWKNLTLERASSNNRIFAARAKRKSFVPYVFISPLLAGFILYYVEQGMGVNYALKTGIKLLVFLLIPAIYFILKRDKNIYILPSTKLNEKRSLFIGLFSGLMFFTVLIVTYYILQPFIDFKPIISELEARLKITPFNFILIGIYITLGNSFIEEFFFRGFVFLGIYNAGKPIAAYFYSSLLFAFYHIMIFRSWFNTPLFILAVFGLFVVGLLFNWMDVKSNNFINSWIAQIFAGGAIILIGLKMFGIVNF